MNLCNITFFVNNWAIWVYTNVQIVNIDNAITFYCSLKKKIIMKRFRKSEKYQAAAVFDANDQNYFSVLKFIK